jgi:integrase
MTWGDVPPLRTRIIRLLEGDLCVLAVNVHGLQVDDANLYCIAVLRPTNIALSTMRAEMDAICLLYNWAGSAGVDLKARIESGEFFPWNEVAALRDNLRAPRKSSAQRRRHSANSLKTGKKKKAAETVSPGHWRNRCVAVRDYVAWMAEVAISRMSVRDPRLAEYRERLSTFQENVVGRIIVSKSETLKEGLSREASLGFLNAITPGHPTNPFQVRHQARNHALWLTYFDGGIRLSEGVMLKGIDLALNGADPKLIVHRRPDDVDDTRSRPSNTKTLPHPVTLTDRLRDALYQYVVGNRAAYKDAKRSPYVFVSQQGGRLTPQAVREMYLLLRAAVPALPEDFSTHVLRYTWNDSFSAAARRLNLSETETKTLRNSAQGWTPDSDQGEHYANRSNRERASEIMLRMQDKATGGTGGTDG